MVNASVSDKEIAAVLAALADLRGGRDLSAKGKESLVRIGRTYAENLPHLRTAVNGWIDGNSNCPTPAELREHIERTPAAVSLGTRNCSVCQGTGFDSFDELLYSFDMPGRRRQEVSTIRLAMPSLQLANQRELVLACDLPQFMIHPNSWTEAERVKHRIATRPEDLRNVDQRAVSARCACRTFSNVGAA